MNTDLALLDQVPALIQRERNQLAEITEPAAMANAERRAAAIADLTKRAGLAVPIQNQATFLRAEALERLAVLVDEQRDGYHHGSPEIREINRRVSEGRALARTGALEKARAASEKAPEKPVSMDAILKQAKRSERETALRDQRASATAAARQSSRRVELTVADVRTWRPNGIHAIVTDPPYITEDAIDLYSALADFAVDVLPDGGSLATMCWQPILEKVIVAMQRPELAFRWVIAWEFDTPGEHHARTFDVARRVHDGWKPILVYHKTSWAKDAPSIYDIIRSPGRVPSHNGDRGDLHVWEQGVEGLEKLVAYTSVAGQTVCDPFMGSGTTGVAALKNDRDFVGSDIDEAHVTTARERLSRSDPFAGMETIAGP